jgi:translation initiation factor IF-1
MTTEAEEPTSSHGPERTRATVLARLNNGMFRLQTADGREVVAHAALDLRKALTRLLPGDPVLIEISPFDPNKARICSMLKSTQQSQHESPPRPSHQRELS